MTRVISITTTPALIPSGTYTVDPAHSRVGFAVKHLGIATVKGSFGTFEGSLEMPGDLTSAKVYGTVDVATVDTNDATRDESLRSAGLFDAEQYPMLTFASKAIIPTDEDALQITGDLTIRGITREITLTAHVKAAATPPVGSHRVGLEIEGHLSRAEYGITFDHGHGSGDVLVSDKIKLTLTVSAVSHSQ